MVVTSKFRWIARENKGELKIPRCLQACSALQRDGTLLQSVNGFDSGLEFSHANGAPLALEPIDDFPTLACDEGFSNQSMTFLPWHAMRVSRTSR